MIRRYQVHYLIRIRSIAQDFTCEMVGDGSDAAKVAWRTVLQHRFTPRTNQDNLRVFILSAEPLN